MRLAVIDGQSAGLGCAVIREIRRTCGNEIEIWALGANDVATSQMMKAGANRGATGERPICDAVRQVDIIIGSLAILVSNAMMGEITPSMAVATGYSRALKLLLPLLEGPVSVVGAVISPLPHLLGMLISEHLAAVLNVERRG
ncbi:MAG TPA: DUF3842 family protein [Syntrophobacteraceae bacterium]|nr:DUF3842 family protein [Syntrophobacteraceae bacterium]